VTHSLSGLRGFGLVVGLATLAGCAQEGGGAGGNRVYYADLQGGAKECAVPQRVSLSNGGVTEAAMTVGNDGGWCGITVSRLIAGAYDAGLLTQRPQRGRVHVHKVGNATRIDYTPDAGFGGTDGFAVKLIPGDATLRVAVTVTGGAPPPAATPPARSTPPARRPAKK